MSPQNGRQKPRAGSSMPLINRIPPQNPEIRSLAEDYYSARDALFAASSIFNEVTDPDLIDAAIHDTIAAETRFEHVTRKVWHGRGER